MSSLRHHPLPCLVNLCHVLRMSGLKRNRSYTKKHNTSIIQISSGQRYSVLLHTKANPEKQQYTIQLETREREGLANITRSYAVLNYMPSFASNSSVGPFYPPASPPLTLPPTDVNFLEYSLCPLESAMNSTHDMPTAEEVTRRVNITVHLSEPGGALVFLQNGYAWSEDVVEGEPYLVSLYKNDGKNWPSMERAILNNGLDPFTRAYPAEIGEVLEIVLQNTGSDGGTTETHPWHAHGAHYWDLGSGAGIYDRAANEAKWAASPGKPVKREYVSKSLPASFLFFSLFSFTIERDFERRGKILVNANPYTDFVTVRRCSISITGVIRRIASSTGGELGD